MRENTCARVKLRVLFNRVQPHVMAEPGGSPALVAYQGLYVVLEPPARSAVRMGQS